MKTSICVEAKPSVATSAHNSTPEHRARRRSGVNASNALHKVGRKKSVWCGAALLRVRLGANSPNREITLNKPTPFILKSQRGRFESSHPHPFELVDTGYSRLKHSFDIAA